MTRQGKCDVCRSRKVKCDEKHPICSPCAKGDRDCSYGGELRIKFRGFRPSAYQGEGSKTLAGGTRDISSSLDGIQNAPVPRPNIGTAQFREFIPFRNSSDYRMSHFGTDHKHGRSPIVKQPSSPGLDLVSRWKAFAEVTNPGELHPYIFGEWQEILPPRFGRSQVLDLAVESFFQCTTAYNNPTENNIARTYDLNTKAIAAIRNSLLKDISRLVEDEILVATTYLKLAVMNAQSGNYKIHVRGGIDFLQRVSQHGAKCTEICKIIFYTSASHEFISYVMRAEDSVFDSPAWLGMPIPNIVDPTCPSPMFAQEYITKTQARLPRLIRLVREARRQPESQDAQETAATLLADMYCKSLESWVQKILSASLVSLSPTMDAGLAPFTPASFVFPSSRIYQRLIAYWELRCIICGLVLALPKDSEANLPTHNFDVVEAAGEEIRAAEMIAMSMSYARAMGLQFAMGMIWQLRPLMMSYGVWYRLGQRAVVSTEMERAISMKQWSIDGMREITSKFNARENTSQELEYLHEILTGGPLPQNHVPE